jgi:RNA polymerase sigma factor (TIGR02999 family)
VPDSTPDVAVLLNEIASGSREAEAALVPLVYEELRRIARRFMRHEAPNNTLQTTALVHEAYMRLAKPQATAWKDRAHFFAVAATVMRRILVDRARARRAEKRGGGTTLPLDDFDPAVSVEDLDQILAVDGALTRLSGLDERQGRIVELRFFAGMTVEETAEALRISPRTVKREWQLARTWLYGELKA